MIPPIVQKMLSELREREAKLTAELEEVLQSIDYLEQGQKVVPIQEVSGAGYSRMTAAGQSVTVTYDASDARPPSLVHDLGMPDVTTIPLRRGGNALFGVKTARKVLAALDLELERGGGPMTVAQAARAVGLTDNAVRHVMNWLAERGRIVRTTKPARGVEQQYKVLSRQEWHDLVNQKAQL